MMLAVAMIHDLKEAINLRHHKKKKKMQPFLTQKNFLVTIQLSQGIPHLLFPLKQHIKHGKRSSDALNIINMPSSFRWGIVGAGVCAQGGSTST